MLELSLTEHQEHILNTVLKDFPQPLSLCCQAFLLQSEPAARFQRILDWFDATLRYVSLYTILDYFHFAEVNNDINDVIHQQFSDEHEYVWQKIFTEIIMQDKQFPGEFFAPEVMSLCHKNYEQCVDMFIFIEDMSKLLRSDSRRIEMSDEDYSARIQSTLPRLLNWCERIAVISRFHLVRIVRLDSERNELAVEVLHGLEPRSMNLDLPGSMTLELDHLYLFDRDRNRWLDLYPFLIERRCDSCQEQHFLFFSKIVEGDNFRFIDFCHSNSLSLSDQSLFQVMGRLYYIKGMYEQAMVHYRMAFERDSEVLETLNGLVLCHEKLGNSFYQKDNFYRAIKHYEEALRLEPDMIRIMFNLALAYRKIKESDEAINLLTRIIRKYPKYFRAFEILGYLYEEKGNDTKALFYYNRFLRAEPKNQAVFDRRKRLMARIESDIRQTERTKDKNTGDEKSVSFEDLVTDMTMVAAQGDTKPIIGRDQELHEICEVLCCMKKNNPLIVGEPGVGKTALVEELARRIVVGSVPQHLLNRRILQLRPASLLAGTKYRGQFEERILTLIKELKLRKNCILFIDDLHTIINAGMTKGGSVDASNALKPELAKGEIQVIGICTFDEYRLYLDKDPAFERRFQLVKVEEPDDSLCYDILEGFREQLETFHNVRLTEEAFRAAVELPRIYLRDRYLPDKALDLLDRACSMVSISKDYSDVDADGEIDVPLVTDLDVVKAVSNLTRIPIAKIAQAQSSRYIKMEEYLRARVIGQEEAIRAVSEVIRTTKMEFDIYPARPDGVFLFVGPTGVGKTELSRVMAEFLFGDIEKMLRIDMSEFTDDISTSKLIGITPGYVGYNDRNQLTDHVRNHPFSLVLLDEIEKANRQVLNLFLQVFDSGRLTDGRGRTVYFNNTTFVMTSNIGAELFSKSKVGYGKPLHESAELFHRNVSKGELLQSVKDFLPPEFINRIDEIVFFRSLSHDDVRTIAQMHLKTIEERLLRDGKILHLTPEALDLIVIRGYSEQYGARNLARAIRKMLLDPLALSSLQPEWVSRESIEVDACDQELVIE